MNLMFTTSFIKNIASDEASDIACCLLKKALLFICLLCCFSGEIMGVNYTVNSTADPGTGSGTTGSLRYCITTANATAGSHTISFSGLAAGSTIALSPTAGGLPDITRTMVIDATTTSGWTSNTIGINLDATNNSGNQVFNVLNVPGVEIYGFQIIGGASTSFGILINGDNADNFKIGAINKRNVINRAGNTIIKVISADNGFVQNNYLGCDVTGTFGYYGTPAGTPPASGSGLWLTDGANGNTIGGSTAGQGNLIAGGAGYGILLGLTGDLSPGLSGCSNNIIYGNRVGGTGTLGNYSCVGIYLDGNSDNNIIGGVLPGQANDLSNHQSTSESSCDGVGGSAVRIRSAEAEGNTIRGNIMQCASSMGIRLQSTGSNNNQPSPSIAGFNTTTNVLSGTVSTPNAIIDVYLGDNCNGDYTTNIKGKQYLASATADGSGNWSIDLTSFICILNNQYVTATATHPTNNSTGQFAIGFLINLSLPVINYAPGTYSVGPSGTFCSLQSVASFLNTYSVSGAYVFEIQPTYNANTETTPIIFNNNSGSSASNTVTIRPAASVTTPIIIQGQNPDWSDPVTGSTDANALIIINGLDYFTLDGRSGGVGTARNLTISNTGSFHSAVSVTNNADYVTIRNCSMLSGMPKRTLAVVSIISNSTAQGNDFVTIQNNNISSNYIGASIWSKYPRSGIYCKSTAATTGINNNITIRDNNIFDIKDANVDGNGNCAAGSGGFGMIHFTANNNAFTVEGNSLYQTNSEWGDCGSSGSTNIYGIYVTSTTSNNNIVRNNFIGGSGPLCAGTWTMPAMTAQIRFNAIHFAPTGNTPTSGTYATITGNTIKNISWNTRSVLVNTALAPAVFSGISVFGAGTGTRNVVIGTNGEGNTIGDNTTTGSILVRNTATSGNGMNIVGISVQGINSGTTTIEHNNIGSITSSTSGIVSTIEGIRVNDGQNIVRFNTIGSTSVSNSFNIVTAATTHAVANNGIQRVRGIVHAGGTAGTASSTVANNTISNLTVNYAANTSGTCGIAIENPTATNVRGAIQIQNNTIRDISYTQARSGTVGLNAAVASTTITGTGVGASVFTGTIATNLTLDVTAMTSGSIVVGQIISGTNIPAGTFISAVVPGTFGGVGQYTVALNLNIPSQSMTAGASNFTGSITGNRLNITAIASGGNPAANTLITGAGITNLRTSATAPTFTTTAATSPNVAGIALSLAGNSENVVTNISGNTIHSLRTNCWQATTGGAVDVVGIHYNGRTAGVQTINGNFIRDFVPSTSFENQSGIVAAGGVATYSNNIIFLGNGVSTHPSINGISETGGANQFYFNTARIVGVPTGTATNSTFAFVSTVNAGTRNIRNNIFANARSSFVDATSRHYAISLIGNTGLTINYNNYVASGANGAVLGRYNADNKTSLATWQTSTTQDANSQSINPAFFGPGSSAMQNRPSGTGIISGAAGTGITTDFGGSYRTCSNALGAIEVEVGGALLPNITITQPAALCGSGTVNLTTLTVTDANNTIGTLSYFSSLADAIAGTPTLASPTSVGAGTYFIRKTKTSGCGYDIKPVTVTINSLPTPTFTVSSSNVCAGSSSVIFTTQSGMTGYTWNITGVGNSIVSGAGTNSVITSWGSNGGNVTLNYTNPNGCTAASAISQAVTITPLATPTFTVTGASPVCQGAISNVFTTQTGRSNYLWSVVGGTITAGGTSTSNTATITWNTPGTGIVAVNYSNAASPLCFANTYTQSNVSVNATTAITSQPTAPASICEGSGTQTLSVTATGLALSYSWRRNGIALSNGGVISGQGTNTLTLTNPLSANAGNYDVVVSGTCGSPVTSSVVAVAINAAPAVSVQPSAADVSYTLNQSATNLSITATAGSGSITGYQWWSNTSPTIVGASLLPGATGNVYTPSTAAIGTLYYFCVITNSNGCSVNSAISGAITVYPIPSISSVTGTTPLVSGQSPFTGYRGQTLTINGLNFASNATISIDGVNATVTFVNSTQLTAVVNNTGANATSTIVVTNPTGGAFSSQSFSFIGYITNTPSDWATPSTWLGGSLPLNGSTATIAHATSCSTIVAAVMNNVIVQPSTTLTLSGELASANISLNGTLAFGGTGVLDISSAFTLGGSATFTCGTGTVRYSGAGDQTLFSGQNNLTYYNLTLAGSGNKSLNTAADFTAQNIVVNAGATLRMQYSNNDAFLIGDFSVNGNLNAEAGTIHFTGTNYQNITFEGAGPLTFNNLRNAKTAGVLRLNGNIKVNNTLSLEQGNINTLGNMLELGKDLTQTGTLNYTAGMVHGIFRRWFAAETNSGVASGFFPMGQLIASNWKGRGALLEYTSAPTTGGHLTVEFMPIPMINGTLGTQTFIPAGSTGGAGFQVSNFSNDGYWKIDNQSGTLTDGLYSLALTGEGFSMPNGLTQVTMVKRVGTGNWFCPGTHLAPTGTASVPTLSRSGISGFSNFGFAGGPNNPLPVILLSFEATCTASEITATWSTASETNNRMFLIEQSNDVAQWTTVDTISGSGNSNALLSYTSRFTTGGAGVSYLRLVQIDFNGTREIFEPIVVTCAETTANEVMIYPNAVSDVANVEIRAAEPLDVQLNVYSSTGQLVRSVECALKNGSNFTRLDVSDLGSGIYLVVLANSKQVEFSGSRYLVKQ